MNHKPKKVKYPFLGEPLYAVDKVHFYKIPEQTGFQRVSSISGLERRRSSRNPSIGNTSRLQQMKDNECFSIVLSKTKYYGLIPKQ